MWHSLAGGAAASTRISNARLRLRGRRQHPCPHFTPTFCTQPLLLPCHLLQAATPIPPVKWDGVYVSATSGDIVKLGLWLTGGAVVGGLALRSEVCSGMDNIRGDLKELRKELRGDLKIITVGSVAELGALTYLVAKR